MKQQTSKVLCAVLAACAGGTLVGQNPVSLFSGATRSTTSRGLTGAAVDLVSRFGGVEIRGAAAAPGAAVGEFSGMRVTVQDQRGATPASFDLVAGSAPQQLTPLATVSLPNSTATGAVAWIVTVAFSAYQPGPGSELFAGARLPAAPSWTSDGLSVHASFDDVNPRARTLGHVVDRASGSVQDTARTSWAVSLMVDEPVLDVGRGKQFGGNRTVSFGRSGLYPNRTGGVVDLATRLHSRSDVGTNYVVLMSIGGFGMPLSLPGTVVGSIHLDPPTVIPAVVALGAVREPPGDQVVIPAGIPLFVDVVLQAFVLRPGGLAASSAVAVRP